MKPLYIHDNHLLQDECKATHCGKPVGAGCQKFIYRTDLMKSLFDDTAVYMVSELTNFVPVELCKGCVEHFLVEQADV